MDLSIRWTDICSTKVHFVKRADICSNSDLKWVAYSIFVPWRRSWCLQIEVSGKVILAQFKPPDSDEFCPSLEYEKQSSPVIPEWRGSTGRELLAGSHFLWLAVQGPLGSGKNPGGGGGCLLGTRAKSWWGVISSGSGADDETDDMGLSAMEVCSFVILGMGGLGDATATRLFITHTQISSFILAQSLLPMTSIKHLWSSWTALQNISGGTQVTWHTTGEWQPVQWSLLSTLTRNPGSAWGLWIPGIPFSLDQRSVMQGEASQAMCITWWVASR